MPSIWQIWTPSRWSTFGWRQNLTQWIPNMRRISFMKLVQMCLCTGWNHFAFLGGLPKIYAYRWWVHEVLFPISTHCSSKIQPQIRTFTPCFTSPARSLPPLLRWPLANHDELIFMLPSGTVSFQVPFVTWPWPLAQRHPKRDKNTFSTNPSHSSTAILLTSSKVVGSRPLLNECCTSISVSKTQIPICCGLGGNSNSQTTWFHRSRSDSMVVESRFVLIEFDGRFFETQNQT